jgi:hydrogenase-1 operon protein HyaF
MSTLEQIPVHVEPAAAVREFGNALPVLGEIRHALERFVSTGEPSRIDLAAMPFGPGDEERLLTLLGTGEVTATIEALGPTRIRETRFPGVWLVDYANADGQRIALQIEVDEVPQLLRTQQADFADSLHALDTELSRLGAAPEPETAPTAETAIQRHGEH